MEAEARLSRRSTSKSRAEQVRDLPQASVCRGGLTRGRGVCLCGINIFRSFSIRKSVPHSSVQIAKQMKIAKSKYVLSVLLLCLYVALPATAFRGSHSTGRSYSQSSSRRSTRATSSSIKRDRHGLIKGSSAAKHAFEKWHPCPSTGRTGGQCPGYVVDHVLPLECGGANAPGNMQWQTIADGSMRL